MRRLTTGMLPGPVGPNAQPELPPQKNGPPTPEKMDPPSGWAVFPLVQVVVKIPLNNDRVWMPRLPSNEQEWAANWGNPVPPPPLKPKKGIR